jgi:uncharacterized membrane protein (UPF0182 family)
MPELPDDPIHWTMRPSTAPRRNWLLPIALIFVVLLGAGTALSYYVDLLWFGSLGYTDVFWTTLRVETVVALVSGLLTFAALYGAYLALKPAQFGGSKGRNILVINGQPMQLPIEPVLRLIAFGLSALIAFVTAAGMSSDWMLFARWWYASPAAGPAVDPILGRPIAFYLFTLPMWETVAGWATLIVVLVAAVALFFFATGGGAARLTGRPSRGDSGGRGLAIAWALVLAVFALRSWLGRFDALTSDHGLFTGASYTDAHVAIPGALIVAAALVLGAIVALVSAFRGFRVRWIVASIVPGLLAYVVVAIVASYVSSFIVRPNQLVRETPYIAHNIAFTRAAFGLDRVAGHPFPARAGVAAIAPAANQATLQNIRLWDWRALQDTLRQIQEIRTYYDFPDIDIDRYNLDGQLRQVMLATRELNVNRLPQGGRTWVNEKLIYTHGYGVTMNPVNGFTPEGLPQLTLANMPVESTASNLSVTRPEVYFGELTTTDVYVKTRQREFNYPQGQTNELTSYSGSGGIVLGGWLRRLLIALDRGDAAKLPFSDDVRPDSRLLMRREIRGRVGTLAPFLTFDDDAYIVVDGSGRLKWILDGFTTSDRYPYASEYDFDRGSINYVRNSVKAVVDAYDGTTTFYVFSPDDPVIGVYRRIFPTLFKDASAMPADLRAHVRYPEMLLSVQAEAYGLYHMTDPEVFYNREDLWTVASQVSSNEQRGETGTQPVEPNFVLMSLPGEQREEFVEILPFTPANRNNMIGWIAGRSDDPHYGEAIVYDFPKTRLVDGPLQIEARIDQDPQLSQQLSLWNQQGSRVRRGNLIVIPIGDGILYAEPVYLQAARSPMPELRIVVLALQDRLVYAPTFAEALAKLIGAPEQASAGAAAPSAAATAPASPPAAPGAAPDINALIAQAAQQMADYQRLTAAGRLGEAGAKLEELKRTLDELNRSREKR